MNNIKYNIFNNKIKSLVILMVKIYKHVTIEFKKDAYFQDMDKEDYDTIRIFFNTIPTRHSSGSTVWIPWGHYYDVTQNNLNETIQFIEANKLYKEYVHINLAFWD